MLAKYVRPVRQRSLLGLLTSLPERRKLKFGDGVPPYDRPLWLMTPTKITGRRTRERMVGMSREPKPDQWLRSEGPSIDPLRQRLTRSDCMSAIPTTLKRASIRGRGTRHRLTAGDGCRAPVCVRAATTQMLDHSLGYLEVRRLRRQQAMTVDTKFESIYRQIELVRGAGDRRKGRLCLMSFAAFLAGESHSDNPATASAVIRRFAMPINDEMPAELRQRLKPFAPLIVGTRDGHDGERASLLIAVMRTELLPRIRTEFCNTVSDMPLATSRARNRIWPEVYQQVTSLLSKVGTPADARECDQIAGMAARLICLSGRVAPLPDQRAWYWAKAADLIDRLCTIGNEELRPAIPEDQVSAISAYLQARYRQMTPRAGYRKLADTWTYARHLLPVLVR